MNECVSQITTVNFGGTFAMTNNDLLKYCTITEVVRQMQRDFDNQDVTAIEELLGYMPIKYLEGYLSEVNKDD